MALSVRDPPWLPYEASEGHRLLPTGAGTATLLLRDGTDPDRIVPRGWVLGRGEVAWTEGHATEIPGTRAAGRIDFSVTGRNWRVFSVYYQSGDTPEKASSEC